MKSIRLTLVALAFGLILVSSAFAQEKPGIEVDWYGAMKLSAAFDQNPTSHGNYVMWVDPQPLAEDKSQFNMTHRSSRFGLSANGKGYENFDVGGEIEFDLHGGGAENTTLLQLRHAYFTLKSGNFMLLAGQTWDLIGPLNPSALNYSVMWGAGNTGYRRPQVSLFFTFEANENTDVILAAGAFRTIGDDLTPTFTLSLGETSDGSDDGTDAAIPSVQGRLEMKHEFSNGGFVRVGGSGLWGQLKSETNLGNSENYESQAVSGHLMVSLANGIGISGEGYMGSNLGSYFGGILNSSTIDGINSKGGWVSAWTKPHQKVKVTGGFGVDDPDDADLNIGNRSLNQVIFGSIQYNVVAPVTLGIEVSQWKTDHLGFNTSEALRAQSSFILNF